MQTGVIPIGAGEVIAFDNYKCRNRNNLKLQFINSVKERVYNQPALLCSNPQKVTRIYNKILQNSCNDVTGTSIVMGKIIILNSLILFKAVVMYIVSYLKTMLFSVDEKPDMAILED